MVVAWDHVALSVPNIAESIAWYETNARLRGSQAGRPAERDADRDDSDNAAGNAIELIEHKQR